MKGYLVVPKFLHFQPHGPHSNWTNQISTMLSPKEVLISNTKVLGKCRVRNDAPMILIRRGLYMPAPAVGISRVRQHPSGPPPGKANGRFSPCNLQGAKRGSPQCRQKSTLAKLPGLELAGFQHVLPPTMLHVTFSAKGKNPSGSPAAWAK